jgi:hypothetical protein
MALLVQGVHFGAASPGNIQQTANAAPPSGQPSWSGAYYTFGLDWTLDALQCECRHAFCYVML